MPRFATVDQAKPYLIGIILDEAMQKDVDLSQIEQDMLAYSSGDEPRFAAMNQAFEEEYNEVEYENTISDLIKSILSKSDTDLEAWNEATALPLQEDHYLSVLIEMSVAEPPQQPEVWSAPARKQPFNRLKLIATAMAIVAAIFALILFWDQIPKH